MNKETTRPTSAEDKIADTSNTEKKIKTKNKKSEKKRYKILAGNGCHQAICDVKGMLVPSPESEKKFQLILPDGLQIDAYFKTAYQRWIAMNKPGFVTGLHWFRGYPKFPEKKLTAIQIVAWDYNMIENQSEQWDFIGVWTAQGNLTVQRSMANEEVRKEAKETGFLKNFKYTFTNSFDFKRSLWIGYVYKILASREGEQLKIKKVIPYACPRIKPKPPAKKPQH